MTQADALNSSENANSSDVQSPSIGTESGNLEVARDVARDTARGEAGAREAGGAVELGAEVSERQAEKGGAIATQIAPESVLADNKPETDAAGALAKTSPRPPRFQQLRQNFQRNKKLFLGTGAAAVIVGAGAAAYVTQEKTGPSPQQAMGLVPENAIATVRFTNDAAQWEALRTIGTPSLQIGLGQWLALGRDRITNLGYGDWKTLQSQIDGKATLALIPSGTPTQPSIPGQRPNTAPPDLLVVVPVKNPAPIKREIANIEAPEGFENRTSSHRGVEIFEIQADLAQRHNIALVGSFWVMASNRDTVTQAIDSFYDGKSIAQSENFRDSRRQLGESTAFMDLYLNTPAATQAAAAAGRLLPLPADVQGLTAQVNIVDNGLAIKSLTTQMPKGQDLGLLAPNREKTDPINLSAAFGDRFPTSTSLLLSGSNMRDAWISHSQSSNASPLFSAAALREQINTVTSMDLDKDWLSWMDGAYSVGILPISSQANSRFQTGLTVMVQTSNRRLAERSLKKLDSLMVNKYRMRLNTGTLAGQPVVNWSSATGEPIVTHGWLDGNVAFLIVGAPGANSLLPQPRATLGSSPLFREGMPRAEQTLPTGQLFVDVDRVSKTNLTSLLPLPTGTKPFMDALKSVGAERRVVDERLTRYDLSFQFLRSFAPPVIPESEPESTPSDAETAPEGNAGDTESPVEAPDAIAPEAPGATTPVVEPTESTKESPELPALPNIQEDLAVPDRAVETDVPDSSSAEPTDSTIDVPATDSSPTVSNEKLGPAFPKDPYNRDVLGPKLPRPSEIQWSDSFVESSETPIPPIPETELGITPAAEPTVETEFEEPSLEEPGTDVSPETPLQEDSGANIPNGLRPAIPLGPELPEELDRTEFGPQFQGQ